MPWVAIPYPNKTIRHVLMEKYGVRGFPTLLIIDKEGNVQTYRGRELVTRDTRAKVRLSASSHLLKIIHTHSCDYAVFPMEWNLSGIVE